LAGSSGKQTPIGLRTLQAAEIVGLRAMLTHAKDEEAVSFYRKFGFEPSPTHEKHLFLLLKDIRASLGA